MQQDFMPALVVPIDRLRARCDSTHFSFATTATLDAPPRMVGQDRAAEALDFGLRVPDSHYNIFVAGPPGSGRSVSSEYAVRQVAATMPAPDDWCYVYNFAMPYAPHALRLPAGAARPFARAVDDLIEASRQALGDTFDAVTYRQQRAEALRDIEKAGEEVSTNLDTFAREHGFVIRPQENGPNFLFARPAAPDSATLEPYSPEEFNALSAEERARFDREFEVMREEYAAAGLRIRDLRLRAHDIMRKLDVAVATAAITPLFDGLKASYPQITTVAAYLDQMLADIIANPTRLRPDGEEVSDAGDGADSAAMMAAMAPSQVTRYRVNVLVDHGGEESAPCIHEHNPTYYNMMGRLEYGTRQGNLYTDFSFIKPGALHQANGGFLIIHVREIINAPRAWETLKRSLRTNTVTIENLADPQQPVVLNASLKPEPIPLQVKVLLIGDHGMWDALNESDPDFGELFKVRADFDPEMPRNPQTELYYAQFVGDAAREMKLPPLTAAAVARVVEEGSRMADDQTRLTSSLTGVRDLVIEAGYWARQSQTDATDAAHVDQAIKTRRRRLGLLAERMDEQVRQGAIMLATTGAVVGQINALSMISALGQDFGRPMRVTATTAPGLDGVVDIAQEAKMSGPLHTKGVRELVGFIAGKYGQEQPLSLAATLAFEQMYHPVEGDSASLAEACALLSALSGVPIRQNLAVTGSVNQWGDAQSIGGVTLKAEGFFDLCLMNGLTGDQGVIIPAANVRNLMLRLDVIEAARNGRFRIYAVKHIDQALWLLTGLSAGQRDTTGVYPPGSINTRVLDTLRAYAERVRHARHGE